MYKLKEDQVREDTHKNKFNLSGRTTKGGGGGGPLKKTHFLSMKPKKYK